MPRLEVIVTLGPRRQEFFLDAPLVTVGRAPDATLVLALPQVALLHILIEPATANDSIHVRLAAALQPALLDGQPLTPAGASVPLSTPFVLEIPGNDDAPPLRIDAVARPTSTRRVPPAPTLLSRRAPLAAAGAILLLAALVAAVTLIPRHESPPASTADGDPTTPPATPPATRSTPPGTPTLTPASPGQSELLAAATALTAGRFDDAHAAVGQASLAGAPAPLTTALAQAITDAQRLATVGANTPGHLPATPLNPPAPSATTALTAPTAEPLLTLNGKTLPRAPHDASHTGEDAEAQRARAEQARKLLSKARDDAESGLDAKLTSTGRAALSEAKRRLQQQLAANSPHPPTFPDDSNEKILVRFDPDAGTYTVRGFLDEYNARDVPYRAYYLLRLKPTGADAWKLVDTEILK